MLERTLDWWAQRGTLDNWLLEENGCFYKLMGPIFRMLCDQLCHAQVRLTAKRAQNSSNSFTR
jgi:hypothetical protein